jgi:DNA-binding MarR family transcriptional regulator
MKLEDAIKTTRFADERHKATLNLLYTAYWLKNQFSTAMKGQGLTMEQFNVMRILKGKAPQPMCVKDIASRMIEKNSNVPRIVDKLVVKGLVARNTSPEDKRETLIELTEKGVKNLVRASQITERLSEDIMDLDDSDAVLLNSILEKMRKTD